MMGIDKSALERFVRVNETILKAIPEAKKAALYAAAQAAQKIVRREIDSRLKDTRGRVQRWQEVTMGSKGGYSRVSPSKVNVANRHGKSYGYTSVEVTSFLEHGHGVRQPSGKNERYKPRLKKAGFNSVTGNAYVPGRMFYSWSQDEAEKVALEAAYDTMDQISDDYADLLSDLE